LQGEVKEKIKYKWSRYSSTRLPYSLTLWTEHLLMFLAFKRKHYISFCARPVQNTVHGVRRVQSICFPKSENKLTRTIYFRKENLTVNLKFRFLISKSLWPKKKTNQKNRRQKKTGEDRNDVKLPKNYLQIVWECSLFLMLFFTFVAFHFCGTPVPEAVFNLSLFSVKAFGLILVMETKCIKCKDLSSTAHTFAAVIIK